MSRRKKPKLDEASQRALEEVERLEKEADKQAAADLTAWMTAWMQEIGFPMEEDPPQFNAEIIPFSANRTRRKP